MKRREFALGAAALGLPALWPLAARAANEGFVALKQQVPTEAPEGKVEVIEFFSYGCVHCMRFAPMLEEWKKTAPPSTALRLVHVGFNAAFEPLQKLHLALESIDQVELVHDKIFHALQEEHVRLDQPDVAFSWMAEHGVDRQRFEAAYKSFGVATKVRQAIKLQDAYGVEGTPAFGIAGRYYTDGSMAKGLDRMLAVADLLIDRESKKG